MGAPDDAVADERVEARGCHDECEPREDCHQHGVEALGRNRLGHHLAHRLQRVYGETGIERAQRGTERSRERRRITGGADDDLEKALRVVGQWLVDHGRRWSRQRHLARVTDDADDRTDAPAEKGNVPADRIGQGTVLRGRGSIVEPAPHQAAQRGVSVRN